MYNSKCALLYRTWVLLGFRFIEVPPALFTHVRLGKRPIVNTIHFLLARANVVQRYRDYIN